MLYCQACNNDFTPLLNMFQQPKFATMKLGCKAMAPQNLTGIKTKPERQKE